MSDIALINDSQQSAIVTNGIGKNGEIYMKAAGSTDAGALVVYDSGSWRKFEDEASSFSNAYSVSFDNSNDYATATLGSQVFDGDYSISFWFNANTSQDYSTLFQSGPGTAYTAGFRLYRLANGSLQFYKGLGGYVLILDAGSTSTNTWYHVAITRSGTTTTLYLNGSSIDTGTDSAAYASQLIYINTGALSYFFGGLTDEVALWDSALSASDISTLRGGASAGTLGVPGDISSLDPVNWWRMGDNDGGTGTTITDQGSGSNDVTLVNGPTFSSSVPS